MKGTTFLRLRGVEKRLKEKFPVHIGKFAQTSRLDSRVVGRSGGSLVHRQVQKCIKLYSKSPVAWKTLPKIAPETVAVMKEIQTRQWIPLYSEYPIGDIAANLGTAIDLLCFDPKTRTVQNIELKVGYHGNFDTGNKPLSFCKTLLNSPCNLALLQTMMNEVFLNKYGVTNVESHVWRLYQSDMGVCVEDRTPPREMREFKNRIFTVLSLSKTKPPKPKTSKPKVSKPKKT